MSVSTTQPSPEAIAAAAHAAAHRIKSYVKRTPLLRSESYSERLHADVHFKLENLQTTGSFKLRGATNRLLTLTEQQRERGCVAASSGNHGAAVACALQALGHSGIIFVPQQTSSAKVEKIRGYGSDVRFFGTDGLDTEQHARAFAAENARVYLPPYNDELVIAGQGTCGVEILEQLPDVDVVIVAVGGGGLISGVGAVMKHSNSAVQIIGCQPAASAVMAKSIEAGTLLDLPSAATLSDGTAGGIEVNAITFDLCDELVDDFVLVQEDEIAAAIRAFKQHEDYVIEGAAGVAVAALQHDDLQLRGRKIAVIVCGGNIAEQQFAALFNMA